MPRFACYILYHIVRHFISRGHFSPFSLDQGSSGMKYVSQSANIKTFRRPSHHSGGQRMRVSLRHSYPPLSLEGILSFHPSLICWRNARILSNRSSCRFHIASPIRQCVSRVVGNIATSVPPLYAPDLRKKNRPFFDSFLDGC